MPQTKSPKLLSARDAREQAAAMCGFMASVEIDVNGKPFEIPNPSLLSPEQQDRYDELEFQRDTVWDRYPDPLNPDGTPKLGTDGIPLRGPLRTPPRINGQRVPNYETQLAQALFGDEYDDFIAAGGYPSQVMTHWAEMRVRMEEREKSDPKSVGGDDPVVEVPEAD